MGSYAAFLDGKMEECRKYCGKLEVERDRERVRADAAEAKVTKMEAFARAFRDYDEMARDVKNGMTSDGTRGFDQEHDYRELRRLCVAALEG